MKIQGHQLNDFRDHKLSWINTLKVIAELLIFVNDEATNVIITEVR